jgi:hypothetical protein
MKCLGVLISPPTNRHLVKRVIFKLEVNNENKKESTSSVGHNKFTIQFKEQILDLACRCVVLP